VENRARSPGTTRWECRELAHGANKGPVPRLAGNTEQKPQVKAKVFALNWEELEADTAVVEGTFSIHGCLVTALIDPGSTYSFVNEASVCPLDWVGRDLSYVLHVSTPLGRSAVASRYVPDYDMVGREILIGDLILMAIKIII
jgi:hypothetical protein